jgi:transketolase
MTENQTARGAYIARNADGDRQITLIASGSEVGIALAAQAGLAAEGVAAAVVSAPCLELFWQQDAGWRESVIGDTPRIVIEAALRQPWDRLLRDGDEFVGYG